jgi:glutamyl-tRNA reductase
MVSTGEYDMRIGVLGINSKLADLQLRERLAKACQRQFSAHCASHLPHSIVLLSTCNRTELYFASEDLAVAHSYILNALKQEVLDDFDQKLYSYFGSNCFHHLCRVTTGLDSAILGETEIQGQVKSAYEQATEYLSLPKELHYLFQKSLMLGKKARAHIPVQRNLLGLEHAVYNAGNQHFSNLEEAKILFIGASEINCKVAAYLKERQLHSISICNRSAPSAKRIAEAYRLQWLDWSEVINWHQHDWIIFGTKSSDYLFTQELLNVPFEKSKLLVDLSVPRNVDPRVSADCRIKLLNIDELNSTLTERKQQMNQFLCKTEELISQFTQLHTSLFYRKQANLSSSDDNHRFGHYNAIMHYSG